jgi:hypothetical protein
MSNVTNLEDHRPHISLVGQKQKVHVLPVSLAEGLATGRIAITDVDPELIRDIVADWLTQVQDNE